jgi:hypothetical protein
MNTPSPSTKLDEKLESARTKLATIHSLADKAMKEIDAWLEAEDRRSSHESVVMCVHADKIRSHSVALAERIAELGKPSTGRVLLLSGATRILDPEKIVETEHAYDEAKINTLDERDIRDAIEFDTELKDMFGFAWIDDEVRMPLHDALHLLHDLMEDGVANVPGTVVRVLKILLKGHPRGFGRYYSGSDPWPRPSAEIQAEIDARMPDALDWLRYELAEALEEEAAAAKANSEDENRSPFDDAGGHPSDGYIDDDDAPEIPMDNAGDHAVPPTAVDKLTD